MSGLDWYPRNSKKALDGMRHLSLELRGAYNTLLDLIYLRGGAVPDDERWLAGNMGCSVRRWRQLRQDLLDDGRIIARGEGKSAVLSDERAEEEIENQNSRRKTNGESGSKGGRKTAEKRREPSENNTVDQATAEATDVAPLQLRQDSKITPLSPPLGADLRQADIDAIWAITPSESRKRSSRKDVGRALLAAVKRGKPPANVLAGLKAYFASDQATKDGGAFVKGVHRMIENDRWEAFIEPDPAKGEWTPDRWRAALRIHVDSGRQRWSETVGPRPGEPGCRAPADVLAEFGFGQFERSA